MRPDVVPNCDAAAGSPARLPAGTVLRIAFDVDGLRGSHTAC